MSTENKLGRRDFLKASAFLALSAQEILAWQGNVVQMVMKQEEATKYINEQINPRLTRALNKPNQIPGIHNRLQELLINTQPNGKISYIAVGGYNPIAPNGDAHMDWDPQAKKPVLMAFVPTLQRDISKYIKEGYRQEEIDLIIAILFAHEEVHYELTEIRHKYPSLAARYYMNSVSNISDQIQEAEAWGITVLEMIRPALLIKGLRLPENFIQISKTLRDLKDNYNSPAWINAFGNYGK